MSHVRTKIDYFEEGSYGEEIRRTLFLDSNRTCDCDTFYDDNGNVILSSCEGSGKSLLAAIVELATGNEDSFENWHEQDLKKIEGENSTGI